MKNFQVTSKKLPVGMDGKAKFATGELVEAESMADLIEDHPSLNGKVKRYIDAAHLEVATPEKVSDEKK